MISIKPFTLLLCLWATFNLFSQENKWKSYPDSSFWNFYSEKTISVDQLLERSGGKRLLVFYFEHKERGINSFNQEVLSDTAVTHFIQKHFYPLAIDLDIDNLSGNEMEGRGGVYRKFIKEQTYYIEQTPAFSIYNTDGQLRGSKAFIRIDHQTTEKFLEFLKKRLK